jgi:hypothetical protein
MRPFKHVAPRQDPAVFARPQNVLGVSLCRFAAPWGEIPVVATSEIDRITVLYWNARRSRWDAIERPHGDLSTDGATTDAPLTWNWSDRVGMAASRDTLFVVYKRASAEFADPPLTIDRYRAADGASHELRLFDSNLVGLVGSQSHFLGRSLWCGLDPQTQTPQTQTLLVLCQTLAKPTHVPHQQDPPDHWQLRLFQVSFDAFGPVALKQNVIEEKGGFDLDARIDGRSLLIVHRSTPDAVRFPLTLTTGAGLILTSDPQSDSFYEPLNLCQVDLDTLAVSSERIPGGEHPQIQHTQPLLITFDRSRRTTVQLDTRLVPFPAGKPQRPRRPHAFWSQSFIDKIAWLRQGGIDSRGVLLSINVNAIPRSLADFSDSFHLFELRGDGLLRHAMPFATAPIWLLGMTAAGKSLTLDILHHKPRVGLYRTRLTATVADREITASTVGFEVWDIGHAQIGDPLEMVPDATPENAQFEPIAELKLSTSTDVLIPPARADNTIGGHLVADLAEKPVGFFAYTDLGDGGLRVIFAPDIPALADPPPVEPAKALRPEQVTGPHLPCEQWVEIPAADFSASGLPQYFVGVPDLTTQSLGSSLEVPIDSIDSVTEGARAEAGLTNEDFDKMDRDVILPVSMPRRDMTFTTTDGRHLTVTMTPGSPVNGVPFQLDGLVDGVLVPMTWLLTPIQPPGPGGLLPPPPDIGAGVRVVGNPAINVIVLTSGPHLLSIIFDPPANAPLPDATTTIDIGVSIQHQVWDPLQALYRELDVEQLHFSFLQYEVDYNTPTGGARTVQINHAPERATQLRFSGRSAEQGQVDYREKLSMSLRELPTHPPTGTVGHIHGPLSSVFDIKKLRVSFHYGRPFTTGMLMRDQRAANPLSQVVTEDARSDLIERSDPLRHAAIGGKPIGSAWMSKKQDVEVDVLLATNLLTATLAAIVSGLTILGLTSYAATIADLFSLAALVASWGPVGFAAGVVVAALLFVGLVYVLPRAVEGVVRDRIRTYISSKEVLDNLNGSPLLRFSGEGMAEAIARKALQAAIDQGLDVPAPATDPNQLGFDRFRGQTFQIVFVSNGICRVLLRFETCADDIFPKFPDVGDDGDGGPGIVSPDG